VLVCNSDRVDWVNADAQLVQSFRCEVDYGQSFVSVALEHDGRAFWVYDDDNTEFWRFDLFGGGATHKLELFLPIGSGTQRQLYQPDGIEPGTGGGQCDQGGDGELCREDF
jgi:hypothetical protein